MIKRLTFLISGLLLYAWIQAGPVNELILKAGSAEDYPKAAYLTIFDSTSVDVQETGLSYVNIHKLYKILTAAGAKELSTVTFGYDPLSAWVDIKKVVIYRASGEVEELDVTKVLDYPAPARAIYWGASEKMLEVGRLKPGDALEVFLFRKGFTYALLLDNSPGDEKYIPPMKGHFYDIIEFWSNEPILEKVYKAAIPKEKTVQYEFYNGEVRSSAVLQNDKMIYTFTKTNILPMESEPSQVAWSDVAPKLLISTSPDWNAKSLWFYGVNEDFGSFEYTPEIKAKVDELLKEAYTEMDSISILTHWVADEIRYSGISMGEGEGFTLHKGEMTFTDRCGVCKDKAGMLITMLRAAGFESYPAMTMAGSRIDYIPADQFNHSVTVVKLRNGEYMLLDPTWVPFLRELWSSAEQQQNYLMGVPESADLMITPVSDPENHFIRIYGTSEILPDGSLEGTVNLIAEGQSDAAIRRMFTGYPAAEWEKNIEAEIKNEFPLAQILETEYEDPWQYMKGPIKLKIKYKIPGFAIVSDQEILFTPVIASEIFMRGMSHLYMNTSIGERKYPFRDRCSRLVKLEEQIKLPGKYSASYLPSAENFEGTSASFEGGYKLAIKGDVLRLNERIALNKRIYEKDEWPEYRKAVEAQKKFASEPVILRKVN